jgi:hypothetical protein
MESTTSMSIVADKGTPLCEPCPARLTDTEAECELDKLPVIVSASSMKLVTSVGSILLFVIFKSLYLFIFNSVYIC